MAYGYTIEPHKSDPLVEIADQALLQFSAATVPGAWLVDTIPLRQLIFKLLMSSLANGPPHMQ